MYPASAMFDAQSRASDIRARSAALVAERQGHLPAEAKPNGSVLVNRLRAELIPANLDPSTQRQVDALLAKITAQQHESARLMLRYAERYPDGAGLAGPVKTAADELVAYENAMLTTIAAVLKAAGYSVALA